MRNFMGCSFCVPGLFFLWSEEAAGYVSKLLGLDVA